MSGDERLKRLRLRSWRRGTKEMDLLLGPFADVNLAAMPEADLDLYESLLAESDQDLYAWVTGRKHAPDRLVSLLARVSAHATEKFEQQRRVL